MFRSLTGHPREGQVVWVELDDYLGDGLLDWANDNDITHLRAEVDRTYEDDWEALEEEGEEDDCECMIRIIDPQYIRAVQDEADAYSEDDSNPHYSLADYRKQYARLYMLYTAGEPSIFDKGNLVGSFPRAGSPRTDRRRGR